MKLFVIAILILVAHSASAAGGKGGGGGMGEGAEKRINKTVVKPNSVKQARTWKDVSAFDKRVIMKPGR